MNIEDVLMLQADGDASPEAEALALQRAINEGTGWLLEGPSGRAMMQAIEDGRCMLGESPAADYYGNRIPARHEVQEGTTGSRGYVVAHMGEEWAAMLEAAGK